MIPWSCKDLRISSDSASFSLGVAIIDYSGFVVILGLRAVLKLGYRVVHILGLRAVLKLGYRAKLSQSILFRTTLHQNNNTDIQDELRITLCLL